MTPTPDQVIKDIICLARDKQRRALGFPPIKHNLPEMKAPSGAITPPDPNNQIEMFNSKGEHLGTY